MPGEVARRIPLDRLKNGHGRPLFSQLYWQIAIHHGICYITIYYYVLLYIIIYVYILLYIFLYFYIFFYVIIYYYIVFILLYIII
jgi:hypothetical protein